MSSPTAQSGRVRLTPYGVIRMTLGLILLSAAALKGHQLATEPVAGTGLLTSRWFLIGVVEFELFFGLWLWFGVYPRRTWQVALLCFGTFGCVTLYKALSGEVTCGCFGRVRVDPRITFPVDLAMFCCCRRLGHGSKQTAHGSTHRRAHWQSDFFEECSNVFKSWETFKCLV